MFNNNKMSDTLDLTSVPTEEPSVTEVVEDVVPEEVAEEVPAEPVESEEIPAEPVEPEVPAPPSTEEVVETVQSMLSEPVVSSSEPTSLEERVKLLEERVESLIDVLKKSWICNENQGVCRKHLKNSL